MSQETDGLRKSLQQALEEQELDISEVYAIALELAKSDTKNIRFLPDAGIIRKLGEELVSRKETAVAELVKNSYDADAPSITLTFSDTDKGGGSLTVKDTGSGMSSEEILGGFMRLAASNKVTESLSPVYHRQRAGRKGIGRFSVQRLGDALTLTTKRSDAERALQFHI
ncbi:MAG: ATP-binding protein, partial [Hymenobacter sp.]